MRTSQRIRNIVYFIGISILSCISVILCGFIISQLLSFINILNSELEMLLLTWTALVLGLCIIPYVFVNKIYNPSIKELGIGEIKNYEILCILSVISLMILYLYVDKSNLRIILLIQVVLQNMGVAFSEEFFSKGILFFIGKKITSNKGVVVIISSIVFAFMFHSGDLFMTNLTYRFPMGIILGIIYLKTDNIYLPIILHVANNLVATSLLK